MFHSEKFYYAVQRVKAKFVQFSWIMWNLVQSD